MTSDEKVKLLEREVLQLTAVVRALAKRHYGDFPMPPENLRMNVGTNTSEANYWAQGVNSSARVVHVFGKQPGGPILDWGCGRGRTPCPRRADPCHSCMTRPGADRRHRPASSCA